MFASLYLFQHNFINVYWLLLIKVTNINNFRNLREENEREKKLKDSTKRRKWKCLKYWAKRLRKASQTWIYKWSIFLKKYKKKVKSDILSLIKG